MFSYKPLYDMICTATLTLYLPDSAFTFLTFLTSVSFLASPITVNPTLAQIRCRSISGELTKDIIRLQSLRLATGKWKFSRTAASCLPSQSQQQAVTPFNEMVM